MKKIVGIVSLYFLIISTNAQTTFSWVNYLNASNTPVGATDYTYTLSGSGFSDNVTANITSSAGTSVFKTSSPKYNTSTDPLGYSCSTAPNGLLLSVDWTNITSNVTVTLNFNKGVNGVCGPVTFSIYDINDDGYDGWNDAVSVSAVNSAGAAMNITKTADCNGLATGNNSTLLTLKAKTSSACNCYGNNTISIGNSSTIIKSVTIKYFSASTSSYNNLPQYIVLSNISTGGFACSGILPIELISFKGSCSNNNQTFEWITASEINNDFFTIEASTDAENYIPIGTIKGSGTSTQTNNYQFTSANILYDYKYYRLKQTDFDGKYTYSTILTMDCENNLFTNINVKAYPNPATNLLNISLDENINTAATIDITDLLGTKVMTLQYRSIENNEIDISSLNNGIYLLNILSQNQQYHFNKVKFIKQ